MQKIESKVIFWVERYLYHPRKFDKIISYALLPLTLIYTLIVTIKRQLNTPQDFQIPIISVGNLTLGGSGKTPLTINLTQRYEKCAIILRGYKRDSSGLIVVSLWGECTCSVKTAGDEAYEYARSEERRVGKEC